MKIDEILETLGEKAKFKKFDISSEYYNAGEELVPDDEPYYEGQNSEPASWPMKRIVHMNKRPEWELNLVHTLGPYYMECKGEDALYRAYWFPCKCNSWDVGKERWGLTGLGSTQVTYEKYNTYYSYYWRDEERHIIKITTRPGNECWEDEYEILWYGDEVFDRKVWKKVVNKA